MGRAGRRVAETKFNVEQIVPKYRNFYEQVISLECGGLPPLSESGAKAPHS
jgi:hypothetical protein